MEKTMIRISKGNEKMGAVPSISLLPVLTCPANIPCAKDCYVVTSMIGGPYGKSIDKSYRANLELFTADRNEYFRQLGGWLDRHQPQRFRFHVSGDFVDSDHLERTFGIANTHANTSFLAFTKHHEILPKPRKVPRNLTLVASMWPNWGKRPKGYRAVWVQDGSETRIPSKARVCPGNCETCGMCWSIHKLRRDLWFAKH